jgi:hypothetical protein
MRIALLAGITLALSIAAFAQALSGDQIRTTLIGNSFSGSRTANPIRNI